MDSPSSTTASSTTFDAASLPAVDLFVERLHKAAAAGDLAALNLLLDALRETARRERELAAFVSSSLSSLLDSPGLEAASAQRGRRQRDVRIHLGIGRDDEGRGDCYDPFKGPDLLG